MIVNLIEDQHVAIGETADAEPYCSVTILIPRSTLNPILDDINQRGSPVVFSDLQAVEFTALLEHLAAAREEDTP